VARVTNVLAHGRDPCNTDAYLVKTCLSDLSGRLDFGVDFRIALVCGTNKGFRVGVA
jgi:hypothetical protein